MVYFGIVVVLLMTGVIFLVEHRQYTSILHQTKMRGEAVANSIAAVVGTSLISYDYSALQSAADDATQDVGVSYVIILNKEGEVAGFSGQPEQQHRRLTDPVSRRVEETSEVLIQEIEYDLSDGARSPHLDIAVPVYMKHSPVKWGTIRVGLSLDAMVKELGDTRRVLLLLATVAVLIVLLAARFFTSQITRPLRQLAEATTVLARDDLDHEVEESLVGELGDLARSFNKMTDDLKRSRDAIRYQNQHLENMVQERTAALREKARELERANAELKEVDRLKSDFLSNVSHELRTPLTSIRSFTEILRDDTMELSGEERAEFLEIVSTQAQRLTRLISDLLDLSKIEAGEFNCVKERVEMSDVIAQCVETLGKLAVEKDISLVSDLEEAPPAVLGDGDRISQVLTNLVDNAFKFTPAGGTVTISAQVAERRTRTYGPLQRFSGIEADTPEAGPYVVVEVRDTGVGIHANDQHRIFEKFGQVGNVLTNKPQGTGLGLAISSSIMVQLGGAIWVESEVDRGTVMAFSVPVYEAEATTASVEKEPPAESWITCSEDLVQALERNSGGKRVLVVDDDRKTVSEISDLLEPFGYRTVGCHSGHQAVDRARDLGPDVIILDTLKLEISGYDVLRLLKGDPDTARIPVVVLADEEHDGKAAELGAAVVVSKPGAGALARSLS